MIQSVSLQVVGLNGDVEVLHHAVMFEEAPFSVVTSVEEAAGRLYLGSLRTAGFASMPTPYGLGLGRDRVLWPILVGGRGRQIAN